MDKVESLSVIDIVLRAPSELIVSSRGLKSTAEGELV